MDDENFSNTIFGQICFPNKDEQARAAPVSWYGAGSVGASQSWSSIFTDFN
jgi:hypothetical protein